jgi:hypothetical protein
MSVFTFGSIFVNLNAMHALIGPNHMLHRSSPFQDFESLSEMVPKDLPDLMDQHKVFRDESAWNAMPQLLRDAPFYSDGKLIYEALEKLVDVYIGREGLYRDDWCDGSSGEVVDEDMISFRDAIVAANKEGTFKGTTSEHKTCDVLSQRLVATLFTVTAWHRHVGSVGDYYADPDLAMFSWKDREAFGRPKQTIMMSVVAAFTATLQPKLNEDYTHLFDGTTKEGEAKSLWTGFQQNLATIEAEVTKRNMHRKSQGELENRHFLPSVIECSVAV